MAGESSILNMIITLRNNRNQLRSKSPYRNRSYFQNKSDYKKYSTGVFELKKATPEQLKAIRIKIKRRRKKEIIFKIFTTLFVLILFSSLGVFMWNINLSSPPNEEHTIVSEELEENFNFYLTDGTEYFKNRKWHNAIFQYEKALEIHPDHYLVNYRLATALTYQCEEKEIYCDREYYF